MPPQTSLGLLNFPGIPKTPQPLLHCTKISLGPSNPFNIPLGPSTGCSPSLPAPRWPLTSHPLSSRGDHHPPGGCRSRGQPKAVCPFPTLHPSHPSSTTAQRCPGLTRAVWGSCGHSKCFPSPACPVFHLLVSGTRSNPPPQPGVTLLCPAQGAPASPGWPPEPGTAWSPPCNCFWSDLGSTPAGAAAWEHWGLTCGCGLVSGFVTGCPHSGTTPAARREPSADREEGAVPCCWQGDAQRHRVMEQAWGSAAKGKC